MLEDEPITNAGRGSNLTESGIVENDASVHQGDGLWAGVGAVQGIANPILAAQRLALDSTQPMELGRVRPMYVKCLMCFWLHELIHACPPHQHADWRRRLCMGTTVQPPRRRA